MKYIKEAMLLKYYFICVKEIIEWLLLDAVWPRKHYFYQGWR